ncbi:protein of unknown function [Micropruina glycogenica]|uniref:Uncharacterized protein n=1 Tax=Micropruina glycogenica TaxID=75385 RepID=A0A2N9JJN7_9ACTN|nr:protein of unknown function [Micropruina glycogenica]
MTRPAATPIAQLASEPHVSSGHGPEYWAGDCHFNAHHRAVQASQSRPRPIITRKPTVKYHLNGLMTKFQVRNRIKLAVRASELGYH